MVTLAGADIPRTLRYDVPSEGPQANRFDPRMPASL